uniref:Glycerophosphodiester phosphodiesterase n=1 Tax=uncultured bacterium W5-77b TaxID=1131000 RepID=H9BWF2_9BACT|nr:glycerophosphodiester phosphodiesterase [uncultured bacterium W5-77b]
MARDLIRNERVFFQSHRGGMKEVPENTLAALLHSWNYSGAVPEVDIRTTADHVLVCIHDETLDRTTNTLVKNHKVSETSFHELRKLDAGSFFSAEFLGQRVPSLEEIFSMLRSNPQRQLYLDLKDADLHEVVRLIERNGLQNQIIFVHEEATVCEEISRVYESCRTMTWLEGGPEEIMEGFQQLRKNEFQGLSQLQIHLRSKSQDTSYELSDDFIEYAYNETKKCNVELQVRLFYFDPHSITQLLKLGIHWFVTDTPREFANALIILWGKSSMQGKRSGITKNGRKKSLYIFGNIPQKNFLLCFRNIWKIRKDLNCIIFDVNF